MVRSEPPEVRRTRRRDRRNDGLCPYCGGVAEAGYVTCPLHRKHRTDQQRSARRLKENRVGRQSAPHSHERTVLLRAYVPASIKTQIDDLAPLFEMSSSKFAREAIEAYIEHCEQALQDRDEEAQEFTG